VRQLRLVVTAEDYDQALHFYRDALGLPEEASFTAGGGRVTILDAGRATLEITDPAHAAHIDEVEVGRRVAGHIRVAFEVADSAATTGALVEAGAELVAAPRRTPWNSLNARLEAPASLQLTLFTELPDPELPDSELRDPERAETDTADAELPDSDTDPTELGS
jgi:lactoylglutathione lyase